MVKNRLTPKNLKRMRLVLGYKQGELGKALRLPTNYISMYESQSNAEKIPKEAIRNMKSWISEQNLDLKSLPKLKGTL